MGRNRRHNPDVTWQAISEAVLRPLPVPLTPKEIDGARKARVSDDRRNTIALTLAVVSFAVATLIGI
jgi:hypothetical protein